MSITNKMGAALLLPMLALAACSNGTASDTRQHPQAANFPFIVDVSSSPATMNDAAVTAAFERRIGDDVTKTVKLGDTLFVYESGARTAERMLAQPPIVTGYRLRVPAARARLIQQMRGIATRFHTQGGDNATNLLLSLQSLPIACTPRSTVTLVTDGVEESEAYSAAKALAAGKPVDLLPPSTKYLAGCRVRFIGFGLTADAAGGDQQLLPARQLAALRQGWTTYLEAAGVRDEDIEFVSVL